MTPIHAIVYEEGAETAALARSLVDYWTRSGLRVAGLVEEHDARPNRRRCDMFLRVLGSSARIAISIDRGAQARGCVLDAGALLRAFERVRHSLNDNPDIVVLNKFGKSECEGGGARALIADALDRDTVVVLFVPRRNLADFRAFAGPLADEWRFALLPACPQAASRELGLAAGLSLAGAVGVDAHG